MSGICPHCGYNLAPDAALEVGDWRIVPRDGAYYRGERVVGRQTWVTILLSLAREKGRALTTPALMARISEGENDNILASQVSQLRRHLEAKQVPAPFTSMRGRGACGYRWDAAA